jgi:tetratricopeptide (TPR) repeat protein
MIAPVLESGGGVERPAWRRVAKVIVLAVAAAGAGPSGSIAADCRVQLEKAQELLAEQKAREAQELIVASTKMCPQDPQAYNLLGLSYDVQTHFPEAQQAYRRAIGLDPKVASFHDNLAVSYLRSGNSESGILEFQRALKVDPQNQTANLNLAAYSLNQKQFSRAIDYFRAAHTASLTDPTALLGMTEAYFGAGDARNGRLLATKLSSLKASDARIHFSLGLVLAEHGEYRMALEEFQAIPTSERDFATALNLGMAYSRLGKLAEARQSYEEAMRLDPSSPEPYLRMGLDAAGSHTDEAIYWISEAYDRAPQRADVSYALAEQLIRARNYERAEGILSSALQQRGDDGALWEALGDLRSREKRLQDAMGAYSRCLKLSPARVSARLSLADVYRESGQVEQSRRELEKVLQHEPGNSMANAELARIALEASQQDDALRLAQRALAADANSLTANEVLAEILTRDNKLVRARSTLEKLVKLDPDNPRFHYLLSRVLSKLQLNQEAEGEFELSKKLEAGRKGTSPHQD